MKRVIIMVFVVGVAFLVLVGSNRAGFSEKKPFIQLPFGPRLYLFNFYGIDTIDNNRLCAVGNNGIICLSEDGGNNWRVQDSGVKMELYNVKFAGPKTGWVVGRFGTILRTDDGGKNWLKLDRPSQGFSIEPLLC